MSLATPDKIRSLQRKLYGKAKAEPDYRFYLLYDKICRADILEHAYALARDNAGAPGVDGIDFKQIEAAGVEKWLAGLRGDLVSKTYRPQAVRRVTIPKPGGGERPLGIPTIRDRVAQTAAKLVLEPIFEADFEDNAYGYRPKRSAGDAIGRVHRHILSGHTDVVDADLSKYFDTIPHRDLMQSVARRIVDRHVLHLIKMWLEAPVEERDEDGTRRMKSGKSDRRGTPQGGVVSPLLANLYMNRSLHEPVPETLAAHRPRRSVQSPCRRLRRRLRHPLPRSRGRGAGVDEGDDDQARTHAQRGENVVEGRADRTLRFSRLHVRPASPHQGRTLILGRKSLEEERRADQGESRRHADAREHGPMAESAPKAEQAPARLVGLFQLRQPRQGVSGRRPHRRRPRARLPRQTA